MGKRDFLPQRTQRTQRFDREVGASQANTDGETFQGWKCRRCTTVLKANRSNVECQNRWESFDRAALMPCCGYPQSGTQARSGGSVKMRIALLPFHA